MNNYKGFTLIEVLVVIVIFGIMSAIAIPTILSWMPNIRFRGASQDFFGHMHMAKMEAIKRNTNVVVLLNVVACPGAPNAVPEPGGGYTVFIDDGGGVPANAKNNAQDAGEATLVQQAMPRNVALCGQTFPGNWTGFQPNGLAIAGQANAPNNTLTIRNDRERTAILTLSPAGGVRIQ